MRHVQRPDLPTQVKEYLQRRHAILVQRHHDGTLDIESIWKQSRQTKTVGKALKLLQHAMGPRERCMYCLDSHGTDIEHFKPKASYPIDAFSWDNWLLCCTECGRIKGSQFPLEAGKPLLIDPASEDPWEFIDFDPDTGNLMARYDVSNNDWNHKGTETVRVLQLDGREALATGYRRTFKKLARIVNEALDNPPVTAKSLVKHLLDEDEHGLLGWCFSSSGEQTEPFRSLKNNQPKLWDSCVKNI